MKEKIKKNMILSALLLVSVFFSRCQNDEYLSKTENTNLLSAKTWFDNYKTKENFHPAFKNIEYNWENAYAVKLENASGAIAIPMKDNPENSDYKGKKILYLYLSDSGYDAVVHEIFPKQEAVSFFENKKQDFQNLDSFSGYILTWNLREGFIKGAEFEKGLVVKNISSAIIFSDGEKAKEYNLTRKAPADWQLELDPVSVTGGSGGGGCAGCGGVIRFTPTLGGSGIGGGSGGYIGSPRGGSGSSGAGGSNYLMPPPPEIPIPDIKKFLSCLKINTYATLAVFAEKTNLINGNVGHAFISISQGDNVVIYGFYPANGYDKSFSGPGIMGENGGHIYDVSANMGQISPQQLQKIISLSEKYQSSWYDLNANNCSDFATDVLNIAGIVSDNWFDTPGTVSKILEKVPNHTSKSNYAPKTKRTCH